MAVARRLGWAETVVFGICAQPALITSNANTIAAVADADERAFIWPPREGERCTLAPTQMIVSARARLPVRILDLDHNHPSRGLVDVLDLVCFGLVPGHFPHLGLSRGNPAIFMRHLAAEFTEEDVEMSGVIVTSQPTRAKTWPVVVFEHAHLVVFEHHAIALRRNDHGVVRHFRSGCGKCDLGDAKRGEQREHVASRKAVGCFRWWYRQC